MSSPKEEEKAHEELREQQPEGDDGNDEVGNSTQAICKTSPSSGR